MPIDSKTVINGRENAPVPKKTPHSAPDSSLHNRRHSLPLPANLWKSSNTPSASLIESEEAARGEHILDEATVAYRISALRQLNGATRSSHQYAKSTGAQNSTYSQPVIVRPYSGSSKLKTTTRAPETKKKKAMVNATLPPVEAFGFQGIMDSIGSGVSDDLERIAEICARSRYSLSNQYEVHMQPHGNGEDFLQTPSHSSRVNGPALEAITPDSSEQPSPRAKTRGARRIRSAAYGTLETIISSSRSSDEDKSKKEPAAALAEEVRGRSINNTASRKDTDIGTSTEQTGTGTGSEQIRSLENKQTPPPHLIPRPRKTKSIPFASLIIDNARKLPTTNLSSLRSSNNPSVALTSKPARPKTFTFLEFPDNLLFHQRSSIPEDQTPTATPTPTPTLSSPEPVPASLVDSIGYSNSKPAMTRNESSIASTLGEEPVSRGGMASTSTSIFGGFSSWMRWGRVAIGGINMQGSRAAAVVPPRRSSYAEGSLRELLRGRDGVGKGKGLSRGN